MGSSKVAKALFLSYTSVLEPLLHAQGLPHIRELIRRGYDIRLVSFEESIMSDEDELRKRRIEAKFTQWGLKWHVLHRKRISVFAGSTGDIVRGAIFVHELVRREAIDIIHCRSYIPSYMAALVKGVRCVKFIFDMRGFMLDEYVNDGYWQRTDYRYRIAKRMEAVCLRLADKVVTTSEDFRAAVVRHPAYRNIPSDVVNEKVVLIPNCTDMNRFQPDPLSRNRLRLEWGLQESVVFLWLVGAVKKWHMPREVAEFYKAARRVIRNAHLVVLTRDGKAKEALDQVGVPGDGYTIYSPVPEEVAKYIVIGDIGISFLVREAGHSAAVKSAEYLACGLPVVVSAGQSGFDELVQVNDIGVVVKQYSEGEYEDVAREIVKLLRDRTMLEQRSRAVAMQTFSLPRAVELYDKVYSEVLRGGRRRVVEH